MDQFTLIIKVLSGEASPVEQKELDEWLAQSDDNKQEFEDIKLLLENSGDTRTTVTDSFVEGFNNIKALVRQRHQRKKRLRFLTFGGMIMVIGIIGSPALTYFMHQTGNADGFTFNATPVEKVIRQLESRYGVHIVVSDPEVLTCPFTASFYKIESESEILRSLENSLSVKFISVDDDHYRLIGKGCSDQ